MKHRLTEADLEQIFISSRFKKRNPFLVIIYFLLLFVLFFSIVIYSLNFGAFNKKIAWWYQDEFKTPPHTLVDAVSSYQNKPEANKNESLPGISDNSIFIEAINVKAPITFGVDNTESTVSSNLKNGAIQLSGTSLPGEMGNVFVTAHSSNYPWVISQYNSAFALLGNVAVGDLVQIKFHNVSFIYRIKKISVVDPSDTSVMKSDNTKATLTLMTCTPVGTNLKRLIVQADQIIPAVSQNPQPQKNNAEALPAGIH
ncbi:MAG: sortase [Candidatus Berkelbacteria bacterium]